MRRTAWWLALLLFTGCAGEKDLIETIADCVWSGAGLPVCPGQGSGGLRHLYYLGDGEPYDPRVRLELFLSERLNATPDEEQACHDAIDATSCRQELPDACVILYVLPGECSDITSVAPPPAPSPRPPEAPPPSPR